MVLVKPAATDVWAACRGAETGAAAGIDGGMEAAGWGPLYSCGIEVASPRYVGTVHDIPDLSSILRGWQLRARSLRIRPRCIFG